MDAVQPAPYPVCAEAEHIADPTEVQPKQSVRSFIGGEPFLFCRGFIKDLNNSKELLNDGPTLALGVPVFFVFLCLSAFLESCIVSASAHLAVFAVGSYVVFSSYFVANHFMSRWSTSYASIPDDKKFYVLSNLIKSAVLLAYCPSAAYTLYRALALDEWSTNRIRNLGVLYAIPDTVSLLLVSRMATSTRVHHLCVVLFMVVNLHIEYEHESIGRALVVYGIFSTFAYLVNLLLASRFLPVLPSVSLILSGLALAIYASTLGINWLWQVHFLCRLATSPTLGLMQAFSIVVYLGLIALVVRDDLVLVQWLWKNVSRAAQLAAAAVVDSPMRKERSAGGVAHDGAPAQSHDVHAKKA